jgi:hypothetical protein
MREIAELRETRSRNYRVSPEKKCHGRRRTGRRRKKLPHFGNSKKSLRRSGRSDEANKQILLELERLRKQTLLPRRPPKENQHQLLRRKPAEASGLVTSRTMIARSWHLVLVNAESPLFDANFRSSTGVASIKKSASQ